jgi:hypothetical protein
VWQGSDAAAVACRSPLQGCVSSADKGASLRFVVRGARMLFCPHPQPLSHCVGEGCRGARRCALQRVPPLPPAGEGDTGGEGKRPRLTACMRWEKSPLPQRLLAEPLYPYQERAGSGGILHAQQFVNFAHAIGITWFRDPPSFRFPPLREGNRARVEVHPASRGEPCEGRGSPPASRGEPCEGRGSPLLREGNQAARSFGSPCL